MLCYSLNALKLFESFQKGELIPSMWHDLHKGVNNMLLSVTFKNIKYFHCISILHIQPLSKNYGVSWVCLCMENQVNNT